MADRAHYLARTLIARTAALETARREDPRLPRPDRSQRTALVEKVLAVELGITDGATVSLIEAALPASIVEGHGRDREIAAFADFLRQHLGRQLSEP